jgi:hypothetical protein
MGWEFVGMAKPFQQTPLPPIIGKIQPDRIIDQNYEPIVKTLWRKYGDAGFLRSSRRCR